MDIFERPIPALIVPPVISADIPLRIASLTQAEIEGAYGQNTGLVIVSMTQRKQTEALEIPAFSFQARAFSGKVCRRAVRNAVVMEEVARIKYTIATGNRVPLSRTLLDKHYLRKHGAGAYYGQSKTV